MLAAAPSKPGDAVVSSPLPLLSPTTFRPIIVVGGVAVGASVDGVVDSLVRRAVTIAAVVVVDTLVTTDVVQS